MTTTRPSLPPLRRLGPALRRVWAIRGLWLGLLAAGVGGGGEVLLFDEDRRALGIAGLLVGVGLGILAWSGTPATRRAAPGAAPVGRIAWRRPLLLRLGGIALALALASGAILAEMAAPDALFGLQGWLWLAGMGGLLLSCARWYPRTERDPAAGPPWTRLEIAGFGGLLALALVTHVARLDAIPWRFHLDEGHAYAEALRFYTGPPISLFTTTWHDTGLPSLLFAFTGGLLYLTGPTLAGVRLGEALIGAWTLIPVYGIARLVWGRAAAVLAAFFVAVSAVGIHYSRIAIINMTTAFWWAVCFYFLLRGLASRRPGDFVWAGLAAGTSMYTFYGTRLLPYLLIAFLGYLLVVHWRSTRRCLGHLALVAAGFFAGFGPLLGYFWGHPDAWAARGVNELNVPPAIPTTWAALTQDWNILAPLAWANFLSLSLKPSADRFYFAPLLLAPEAVLLLLGLGLLIWRWRQPAAFLLLLAGLGVVFVGGTLVEASRIPAFVHWTPIFPVIDLAVALPLALWWRTWRRLPRRLPLLGLALIAGAATWDAVANAEAYLVQYPQEVPAYRAVDALRGRFVENLPPGTRANFVGTVWPPIDPALLGRVGSGPRRTITWPPFNPEIAAMMGPQVEQSELLNPSRELPLVGDPAHDLAFFFYSDPPLEWPVVQAYYPGGAVREVLNPDGDQAALSYLVPAARAWQGYGVQVAVAALGTPAAAPSPTQVQTVGALPATGPATYPLLATWSGSVYLSSTLPLRLSLAGAVTGTVWIAGQAVAPDMPLQVDPGWVRFVAQARLDHPAPVRLLVAQGAGPPAAVDTAHLWPAAPDQGLAATLGGGGAVAHRIDPFLAARALRAGPSFDPDLLPLGAGGGGGDRSRWEGDLLVAHPGPYTMSLRSDSRAQLTIDGKPVVQVCTAGPQQPAVESPVVLAAGAHRVQVDLQTAPTAGGAWTGVEWAWTPPGGVPELVPPAVLRLPGGATAAGPIPWPDISTPIACPPAK